MVHFAKQLTESRPFQMFIIAVILLAGLLAGIETDKVLVRNMGGLFEVLDLAVIGIFVLEIGLRITAHGRRPVGFFRDGWNVFDFLIVGFSLLPGGGPFFTVLRLARVLRLLRLVTALPKLRLLVGALVKSLSAMGYVSLLLALLFYIYAVVGVHLFGDSDADFGSLSTALLTLFRIVTLDNWGDIFNRAIMHAPVAEVAIFFVTFIVLGTMIILNLFIGIIMNSMSEMHAEIEEGKRQQHPQTEVQPTLDSELASLEQHITSLQERVQRLRRQK